MPVHVECAKRTFNVLALLILLQFSDNMIYICICIS